MNPLQQSLRASLQHSIAQYASKESLARGSPATLRISVQATEAAQWQDGVVALMRPAPKGSHDARWAAARLSHAVFVDPPPNVEFGYPQVRVYSAAVLAALAAGHPAATRAALALPGPYHGLDESACVEYLLLGLLDALAAPHPALEEIVLLEPLDIRRVLIADKLRELFPDATDASAWTFEYYPANEASQHARAPFEQRLTIQDTLAAFIAMPFASRMSDVFHYGIQKPALRCKFRPERLDFEHFTGSIVEQIKERIQQAHLVIADVTGGNPNVFLEIGYAWGKGRPTLLLHGKGRMAATRAKSRPPFDVAADSRIDYESIESLDKQLTEKLKALHVDLRRRAARED